MPKEDLYLGIEGGGTRTIAVYTDRHLNAVARGEFGPGNIRLISDSALEDLFRQIAVAGSEPYAIGIGMAGMRDPADERRIRAAVEQVWGAVPLAVTNDLEIALLTAELRHGAPAVLILSGTGSCCFGRSPSGASVKVGGWGHLLGDVGSGYDIALRALRTTIFEYDRRQHWGILGQRILRALLLNTPEDLIAWAQAAEKRDIAQLAPVVFAAAAARDRSAQQVLETTRERLTEDGLICAARLARRDEAVAFVLAGSVLRKQPAFARKIERAIVLARPRSSFHVLGSDAAFGAVKLAIRAAASKPIETRVRPGKKMRVPRAYVPHFDPALSPTEMRNPRSMKLDRLSISASVDLMLETEKEVIPALKVVQRNIEKAVSRAATALQAGGRIFYIGAGTSGRLGVLDASECPPTFRASPELVQGIIAGGQTALWQAAEGAEDDWDAGWRSLRAHGVGDRDVVIGIAASGRTPFVWGALHAGREAGASTVLLCFNPSLDIEKTQRPHVVIAPDLGPEILTGSTRLKCGTATKLILNMISTISMVRAGKVASNLMIDLNPSNVKLRDRAVRIVRELTGCTEEQASEALVRHQWIVKEAWQALSNAQR